MTGSAQPVHQTELEYLEVDVGAPSGFRTARTSSAVTVEGVCPRCAGPTRSTFRVASPERKTVPAALLERLRAAARREAKPNHKAPSPEETATVMCECGAVHPKRPEGSTDPGCGAFWIVVL